MFKTRLNPTKPSAAHRLVLENVGAACRELRVIEDECWTSGRPNDQIQPILQKHGVLGVGTASDQGGAGDDPLLVAMTAERIGREGLRPVRWFALQTAAGYATRFRAVVHGPTEDPSSPVAWLPIENEEEESLDSAPRISTLLSFDDHLWKTTSPELIYDLNLKFCLAAGAVGVVADCLETIVTFCVQRIKSGAAEVPQDVIEHHVARTAIDLEAARAITYAAAELKSEFDRRPHSDHLRLEAGTLVNEALDVSFAAVGWMFGRTREWPAVGKPLAECLPPRHRAFVETKFFPRDRERLLLKQIARYYLFE